MISSYLLGILRCPHCVSSEVQEIYDPGRLEFVHNCWLICHDCGRKYPIREGIPAMLIEQGDKWINVNVEDLPVPPFSG